MSRKFTSCAVLMGDIVASEGAASVRALHRAFNRAVAATNKAHGDVLLSPLTITLGDEFQGLTRTLSTAWVVATGLRLKLLRENAPCRIVIGAAKIETPINAERAWNMMGPGLAAARERLNQKQDSNAYRFSLPEDPMTATLLDAVGDSLTRVESGWTSTQLAYFAASKAKRTNADLARTLGISERALYKVLRAAQAEFHTRQTAVVAEALAALDHRYGLK